jgi:hypothetical protein
MTASRKSILLLFALTLLGSVSRAGANESRHPGVGGRVLAETSPLAAAGVYAWQLTDLTLKKVLTDSKGNFLFQDLPAGFYKIIAHKPGFVPAVVVLIRNTAQTYQSVEIQLAEQQRGVSGSAGSAQDDFWSVRSQIPGDVLREIQADETERTADASSSLPSLANLTASQKLDLRDVAKAGFNTSWQAMTGVDQIASNSGGLVSGAGVGIEGKLGQTQVGLRGSFWQLSGDAAGRPGSLANTGQASTLSLDLARGTGSRISVTSLNNRMGRRTDDGEAPIDLEHYTVNWSQDVGKNGRSDFAAQYTAENNYHRQAAIEPAEIPEASRAWRVEGAYTMALGDSNTLQTGVRYREIELGTATLGRPLGDPAIGSVDLFGRGGVRVQPAVLLEYGMFSTLSDGSLSLMPQGGIVLQLGSNWQLEGSGSRRVYQDVPANPLFLPTLFGETDLCEQGSEACYQVSLARKPAKDDTDGSISLTAAHRKIGETLRLYFSDEVFDRFESLYLVRGDELPELRLQMSKHLTPKVVTTLESSLASGGGGIFLAADHRPYENQVRYLVASLDTQFLTSSTGVFVAFHHLTQELQPVGQPNALGPQMELDRVRLMLTQDLRFMFDLASDWAVQLNMEVSRGPLSSASSHDNELRRRLMGGIAVKF